MRAGVFIQRFLGTLKVKGLFLKANNLYYSKLYLVKSQIVMLQYKTWKYSLKSINLVCLEANPSTKSLFYYILDHT